MTAPALCAVMGCSIFIASRTTTRSPCSTVSPSATATLTIVPCIGGGQRVAGRRGARRRRTAAGLLRAPPPRGTAAGQPEPAGQHDLEPLAARPRPRSAWRCVRLDPSAAAAGIRLDGVVDSVSIQRVCTVNGARRRREGLVAHDGAVERQRRRHPVDDELVQRAAGPLERLLAGAAGDDELGQHRVERAADDVALDDAGVHPHAGTRGRPRTASPCPGAGRKPAAGVLAVDPELERVARAARGRRSPAARRSAMRNCSRTRSMPVTSSRDRVLDLQAGVDLEERDVAVRADEELAGPRADVAGPRRSPWPPGAARRAAPR